MQKARIVVALSCACASAACSTEIATAVHPRPTPGLPEPQPCTSPRITDRITETSITLPEAVRYRRSLSYFGLPQDERIAFSSSTNNASYVAWLNNSGTYVHVTPVAVTGTEMARSEPDYLVPGTELSGLVAFDDGFALLTRRTDRGDPIGEGGMPAQATHLVRWKNGSELFAVALTGTASITNADLSEKRDYPFGQSGRLAFKGTHYGAYFSVRGFSAPTGGPPQDRYAGEHGDKFVQIDDSGRLVNAWRMGCRQHLQGRLIADESGFVRFCLSDGTIGNPGLQVVEGTANARHLAFESSPPPMIERGYGGGNFGSAVKTASGYLVAWSSRGVSLPINATSPEAAHESHEPAVAVLDNNRQLTSSPEWPFLMTRPPPQDAVNVHAAAYGDKVLVVWETIETPQFRHPRELPTVRAGEGFSTGVYGGTHFRLVDAAGKSASQEDWLPRAIAPNGADDIVQLSNGDLMWAYVREPQRDFQTIVANADLPNLPNLYEIRLVRLTYCIP
jgi:hypothetical protein